MLPCGRLPNQRWDFVGEVNKTMEVVLKNRADVIEMDVEAIEVQGMISVNHMFDFFHLSQAGYDTIFWPVLGAIQTVLGLP